MDQVKSVIQSKAMVASFVTAFLSLLPIFGIVWSAEDTEEITNNVTEIIILLGGVGSLLASLVAAYGRKNATTQIGGIITPDVSKVPDPGAIVSAQDNKMTLRG